MTACNHDSEIAGLSIILRNTMASIDDALDRGDRRAFRGWCKKWTSASARAGNVLADLANIQPTHPTSNPGTRSNYPNPRT
jgi:hypothetical protein